MNDLVKTCNSATENIHEGVNVEYNSQNQTRWSRRKPYDRPSTSTSTSRDDGIRVRPTEIPKEVSI